MTKKEIKETRKMKMIQNMFGEDKEDMNKMYSLLKEMGDKYGKERALAKALYILYIFTERTYD